jgi:hypothetical protein
MSFHTPLAELIKCRMEEVGLDRHQNPLKAAGRVDALCEGHIISRKSRAALERLPQALEL